MSVNLIEPNLLTFHSADASETLEIEDNSNMIEIHKEPIAAKKALIFRVRNNNGQGTLTEIETTPDKVQTIVSSLMYWLGTGKLDYQEVDWQVATEKIEPPCAICGALLHTSKECWSLK